jgi:hypothetical protein
MVKDLMNPNAEFNATTGFIGLEAGGHDHFADAVAPSRFNKERNFLNIKEWPIPFSLFTNDREEKDQLRK